MVKKLGKNLYTSGTRSYKNILVDGNFKLVVVTWVQKRCERCGRFAGKYAKKYCKRCAEEVNKKWFSRQSKEYRQNMNRKQYERELKIKGRKQLSKEQREYYHSIPFEIRSKQNNERSRKLRSNKSMEKLKILNKRQYKNKVKRCSVNGCNNPIDSTEACGEDSCCAYHRLLFDYWSYEVMNMDKFYYYLVNRRARRIAFTRWRNKIGKEECNKIVLRLANESINWVC